MAPGSGRAQNDTSGYSVRQLISHPLVGRAVQRAAIPFDHTDDHVLVILGSYLDQPLDRRAGHIHR